jgi:beta-N-acetylhexosaminidase
MVGFRGVRFEDDLEGVIRDHSIGGIVLFRRNIESSDQIKTLIRSAQDCAAKTLGRSILVAIDQEGGPVQRLVSPPFTRLPSAKTLSIEGADAVRTWAAAAGRELRGLGIQINLAPVLDVLPENSGSHFMDERCLGSEPQRVTELGKLWISALQTEGVSATAKHFPGLGQAELDPHHYAPTIHWKNGTSMQRDLTPFQDAVSMGVHCVMTSHCLYPAVDDRWPATLSPVLCSNWLRHRLGFGGVLLSDDLDMAAVLERYTWEEVARQGLLATIDFFLLCQNPENIDPFCSSLVDQLRSEPRFMALHEQSLARIQVLHRRLHLNWAAA